jgi:quinol-cytochrome oxidoreductase complex cytochrome b subunit
MKSTDENNEEFRKYREQMHGEEYEVERQQMHNKPVRIAFGIFMVIIYIGMGILCMINWFGYPETGAWTVGRWIVGVVLVIYGFWRAYRQYAGIDSRF